MLLKSKFPFIKDIKKFNFLTFCNNNSPKEELVYTGFGIFCIISTICTMYCMSGIPEVREKKSLLYIYESMLILSVFFVTRPLWPYPLKKMAIIQVVWNICIFYLLIICSTFFVMLSNWGTLEVVVFTVNLVIVAILTRWKVAVGMIIVGLYLGTQFYKYYAEIGTNNLKLKIEPSSFILYTLLLIGTAIVIFLKPKQEYQELTEERNEHLNGRMEEKEKEAQEALALKTEFIRNISHEYHAPITGVISMSEILIESYDKLNDQQRLSAIKTIFKSSHSLKAFDNNIVTLARLSKPHYELKKENLDFSSLVYDRIQTCRKLYEENKEDREFVLDIKEGLMANIDRSYMIQLLDNLIINSINYCKKGTIRVTLGQYKNNIHLVISDTGIGIPKNELSEIFEPFTVSSRTKTSAGGRGVGLAICKRILEVHGGSIKAKNNGKKGSSFVVMLPKEV